MIESRKSRGDVAGPSPIWLKLGVVSRLDPKPPKMTLFYVVCTVGGDLEGFTSPEGRKNAISFFHPSSPQVAPMKILLYIIYVTLIPGYTDVKAQRAYFKGADSTRVPRFCTFYFLAVLNFDVSFSDFTW